MHEDTPAESAKGGHGGKGCCGTGSPVAVRVGGDVRVDFSALNLERIGGSGAPAPSAGFSVSRARPVVDVALGEIFSSRVSIEFRQDDTVTTYEDTGISVDVPDWAKGWSVLGREVYLQAEVGEAVRHRVRVGLQEPAFAARERYEEAYPFAGEERADFGRRLGILPAEDLGVGWRGDVGGKWAVDLQLLNGAGGAALDDNDGKDFLARVEAAPIDALAISVSGLYGSRGDDSLGEQGQGALTIEVKGAHQRLLLEGLAGSTTEDGADGIFYGASASGAWDFPVATGAMDAVTLVGRFRYYDPVADPDLKVPDAWWGPSAGAWVSWKVAPGHVVRTGATWEMYTPQDSLLPIEHGVVAEAAWRF